MSNVLKIMPHSLKQDEFTVAMVEAFEIQMQELHEEFIELCDFINLVTENEKVIDMLAFERHVDFYENLSLAEKKNVVKDALKIHMKKGTKFALTQIFENLFLEGRIVEWFEYEGDPYHFKAEIDVTNTGISDVTISLLDRLIMVYKNNRSVLENLDVILSSKSPFVSAIHVSIGEDITIGE